jgi:hypothetical protein
MPSSVVLAQPLEQVRLRERLCALFSFPLTLASLLALWVYVVIVGGGGVGDPDIWWHLRNAEYLLTNTKLPRFDMYSYTALGHPWINHEWLAEIPYYLAWRGFGLVGVYALCVLLLEAILLGLFFFCYKSSGNLKGSFLVSSFSVLLTAVSFGPRTILFGYAYLLVLLFVLWRFRSTGVAPLWILPPLFCLWINTHGSWLLGMIVLGIVVASGLLAGSWGPIEAVRWSPHQLKRLLLALGGCLASLFVNPYGYRLVLYPFDLAFRQKLNIAHVDEWTSVDFHDARGKVVFILLVAVLLGALLGRCRWKLEDLGLAVFALYCGLTHVRFLFLAAILLAPLLAKFLNFIPPYRREADRPLLNALLVFGVLVILAGRFPSQGELENSVAKTYPADFLQFVKARKLPGRIFNFYIWGGYLAWNDPEMKTFIDSRTDVFEYTGVLKDYLDAIALKDTFRVLDKYEVRYVLFPPQEPLSYLLRQSRDWKVIFSTNVIAIFERAGPATAPASMTAAAGARDTP